MLLLQLREVLKGQLARVINARFIQLAIVFQQSARFVLFQYNTLGILNAFYQLSGRRVPIDVVQYQVLVCLTRCRLSKFLSALSP